MSNKNPVSSSHETPNTFSIGPKLMPLDYNILNIFNLSNESGSVTRTSFDSDCLGEIMIVIV